VARGAVAEDEGSGTDSGQRRVAEQWRAGGGERLARGGPTRPMEESGRCVEG
jgi:hypothetical protein